MKQTFREYLMEQCINQTHALDDMLPDVYEDWIAEQDVEDIIDWAEKWVTQGLTFEHMSQEGVRKNIQSCEGKHTQQAVYSTFHDALTQICYGCKKVRSSIRRSL